jgi:hypothetical protein
MGDQLVQHCIGMRQNLAKIEGPAATSSGVPPRSRTTVDQTLEVMYRIDGSLRHESKPRCGVQKIAQHCSSMTINPKQIKGTNVTPRGAPPRSATIIDQTLNLSYAIERKARTVFESKTRRRKDEHTSGRGIRPHTGTCVAYQQRQRWSSPAPGGGGGRRRGAR